MPKINKLTPEQEALIPVVRDEWLAHGLSCEAADKAEAEEGVREAYAAAGLPAPAHILWMPSPMAGVRASALVAQGELAALIEGGEELVRTAELPAPALGEQLRTAIYGQHDASWLGFYDFWQRIGLEGPERLAGLSRIARSAGWWWAWDDVAILTDRPAELHRDRDGRLHREDGMALRYRDGWGVAAWHGVRVPVSLVTGEGWGPEEINHERNAEVRRCAIERLGWDVYLATLGSEPIATADDPGNPGQILQLWDVPSHLVPDGAEDGMRILVCTNGTPEADGQRRKFGLAVPATSEDPVAVAAELVGWPVEAYRRLQVRT